MTRPVALVTGASSGIGRAAAFKLAAVGHDLAIVARREEELATLVEEIGAAHDIRILNRPCDLSDLQDAERIVPDVLEHFGRLDVVLNNAGIAECAPMAEISLGVLQRALVVNAMAPAVLVREAWDALATAPRGIVVNISSLSAIDPLPGCGGYGMSKSAIEGLTRSIHADSKDVGAGIRAFSIGPGAIDTPMLRSAMDGVEFPPGARVPMDEFVGIISECIAGRFDDHDGGAIYVPGEGAVTTDASEALEIIAALWS